MPALIMFGGSPDAPDEAAESGHQVHVDASADEVVTALSESTTGFASFRAVNHPQIKISVNRHLVRFIRDTG